MKKGAGSMNNGRHRFTEFTVTVLTGTTPGETNFEEALRVLDETGGGLHFSEGKETRCTKQEYFAKVDELGSTTTWYEVVEETEVDACVADAETLNVQPGSLFTGYPVSFHDVKSSVREISDTLAIPEDTVLEIVGVTPEDYQRGERLPASVFPLLVLAGSYTNMLYEVFGEDAEIWLHDSVDRVEKFVQLDVEQLLIDMYRETPPSSSEPWGDAEEGEGFSEPEGGRGAVVIPFPRNAEGRG